MQNKKLFAKATIAFLALSTLLISIISVGSDCSFGARGEPTPYSIVFNATKNKIVTTPVGQSNSGFGEMKTELGNAIGMEIAFLENTASTWQSLRASGYITNTDPINGITYMRFERVDVNKGAAILYSYEKGVFSDSKRINFPAGGPAVCETDFGGALPCYFKLIGIGVNNLEIASGKIEFNCIDNNHTLSLINETPTAGTVSGAGIYHAGTSVTISATPSGSAEFQGWYDAFGALKSMDNPYTFTMPGADYELHTYFGPAKGSTRQVGKYPQTKVTDTALISTLNTKAGTLPTADNAEAWTDYQYYIEGVVTSYMWYQDVDHNSILYRGVYFEQYRPTRTSKPSLASETWQDDNGYQIGTTYWFKWEPITWKILDVKDGKAMLLSNLVIDAQPFYRSAAYRPGPPRIYANNYEHSDVRTWLNNTFINKTFTEAEKNTIATTLVDNSLASTGHEEKGYGEQAAPYICNDTNDWVFLLSYVEATNANYPGQGSSYYRKKTATDYAYSQGVYRNTQWGTSPYLLRSPFYNAGANSYCLDSDGLGRVTDANSMYSGIAPVMWVTL
ncbi:MAG: hypothetical protein BWY30_00369 [Tenericutes bacterium ADurb.Bin239]|nr:MAG: hypothetical protein BWY30_00369 [Tenericutes bacterium ADurb.Bin239]